MNDARLYKRTIVKEEIRSEALGATRKIRVYLPPGYDERISYPVFYCQDGEEFFNYGRIATHANRMILDDNVPPFLIVGVDVDLPNRTAQYAPEGEQFAAYCRFFTEEMMPAVEQKFTVQASTEGRILAGDSLGGTVSLHLALDYPHLFSKVLALSGAFLGSTHTRVAREKDLSRLKVYMLVGTEETAVSTGRGVFNFLEANRQTRRLLEERRARLKYEEKTGKHLWGFWQRELPEGMRFLLNQAE